MIFLISISELNAFAMWAHETVLNERLVLSRLIAFAFSHSLGQSRHSDRRPPPPGLPRSTDILGVRRHVSKVPYGDIAET
jgi:hypothetical protein